MDPEARGAIHSQIHHQPETGKKSRAGAEDTDEEQHVGEKVNAIKYKDRIWEETTPWE